MQLNKSHIPPVSHYFNLEDALKNSVLVVILAIAQIQNVSPNLRELDTAAFAPISCATRQLPEGVVSLLDGNLMLKGSHVRQAIPHTHLENSLWRLSQILEID